MPQPTALQLKAEIDADPSLIGYKVALVWREPAEIAALLNEVRTLAPTFAIDRDVIASHEVFGLIEYSEYIAKTVAQRDWLRETLCSGFVDFKNPQVRAGFGTIFPAGSATRPRVIAYQTRPASRAEFLWGPGVTIEHSEVSVARDS